jgi:predicted enzyme related to lactoylglutathione lyase
MSFHGKIIWTELNTHDVDKAKGFYGAAFGWSFDAMPTPYGGTYWIGKAAGAAMGTAGLFAMSGPAFEGMPDHWLTYFGIENIDDALEKVAGLGGQVVRPAFDIPNVGRIAIVRGASGAVEGWMQPLPGMEPA